jgi:hypothetical protein
MSQKFILTATSRTPEVVIDPDNQCAVISGECYPEDSEKFFTELNRAVGDYFGAGKTSLTLEIKLIYFNSSSARALMELMDLLEQRSTDGAKIEVRWFHDEDDDVTKEFVEDIAADYRNLDLELIPNLDC